MTREELRESFAKEIEENMFEGSEAEQKGKEMLEHFADALNSPKE